jgi:hypothetical protein
LCSAAVPLNDAAGALAFEEAAAAELWFTVANTPSGPIHRLNSPEGTSRGVPPNRKRVLAIVCT